MTGPWSELGFSAGGAIEALAATSAQVVEAYARGRIELARAEFRQGNLKTGLQILEGMNARLRPVQGATTDGGGIELVWAITLSVTAQGLEQNGDVEGALEQFAIAVQLFGRLPEAQLNPRDHSDFGIALAVTGAEAEGLEHLHRARREGGSTPEAARHLARIMLGQDDRSGAEEHLHEALLTTPADAEALGMLARIQVDRDDPDALGTLTSAAYALLIRGRNQDALQILDLIEQRSARPSPVVGVRAEALRLDDRPAEALSHFDAALELTPESSWLLAGSASALLALDRPLEARERADLALVNEPTDVDLLNLACDISLALGDWEAAAGHARAAIALEPRTVTAYHQLVSAALGSGDRLTALGEIRKARLLAPHDVDLLRIHGELEVAIGSDETAVEIYRQIVAADNDYQLPDDHLKLAELLGIIGQAESGLAAAMAVLERFGYTVELLEVLIDLLQKLDRPDDAVLHLRQAIATEDFDPYWLLVPLARALMDARKVEEGIEQAQRAIELEPDSAEAYVVKADGYARLNKWREAAETVEVALALDSSDVEALAVAGLAQLGLGDAELAEGQLRQALELAPGNELVHYYLAQTLAEVRPKEAIAFLDPLIEGAPTRSDFVQMRGRALLRIGDYEAALADLELAVNLDPDDESIWIDLADARRLAGSLDQALEAADRALFLAPESAPALLIQAIVLRALGRDQQARTDLLLAVELDPGYKDAYLLLSGLTTDVSEAQQYLERARELAPDDRLVHLEQAALNARTNNPAAALKQYDRLLGIARDPEALVGRIDALRQLGDFAAAVSFAEQAAVETDNDRSVQRALGIALVEGGRLEDGIDVLRQLAGGTGDPTANGDLGWALMAADRAEEALTSFEQALGATLQDPWMLSQTARVLTDIGEFEQAMELANWSMETADESADAWARIGWAAQHLDPPDHARGEQAFDRAWSLQPDGQQDPWVLSCRADSRHVLGDERAREDYETALELARMRRINGIWPLSVIGWCQFRLGDLSAAARTFVEVRSIEEKPGSDVLDLALVTLCHGRSKRALRMYEDAVHLLSTRSGLIQRGLLKVAIVDLQRAPIDFPELKSGPELETATNLLTYALANLPRPPALRLPPDLGGGR